MPTKTVKKKKLAKKPAPAKKTAKPKTKAAAKAKAKATVRAAKPPVKTGFMWKLLEKKELERKLRDQARANPASSHAHGEANGAGHDYSRFNGPRRKAA